MINEIDIEKLREKLLAQIDAKEDEMYKKNTKLKSEILSCTDADELEDLLYKYDRLQTKLGSIDTKDIDKVISAAKLFNTMARQLESEFGAKVDTEEYTIRFKWFGRTINYPVILLSKKYNFHAGMFGFESSFTTHEAYTEDNFLFHIGIDRDNSDTILISFGKMDVL